MIRMSIKRPVAVTMGYVAVALLGVAAWRNIPVEFLPDEQLPRLNVGAQWSGASPETMEAFVTSPLEAAVQQVKGVERVISTSQVNQGTATARIEVQFNRDVDMEFVRLELSERLRTVEEDLPIGVRNITVTPYVPREFQEQNRAFLEYTVTGPHTLEALRAHVDDNVVPELLQVDGIATVQVNGGRDRLIEIEFDEDQLAALRLDVSNVRRQIQDLEYITEAGAVEDQGILRTLAIRQRAGSADDVRNLVILRDRGRLVRISDIAKVSDTYEDPTNHYRIDGQPALVFSLYKEDAVNTVAVADAVKARLASITNIHPLGVALILDYDQSDDIKTQLTDLRERAAVAAVVIFAVLLLFLQSFRSAGVIFATIAFSVLITLNLIYFSGLTLNVLTLMGLAMGFGLIVDNAIVVLENIYRKRRAGTPTELAAELGSKEVIMPILAATLTTLIVFIPFVYLQGELRVYYVPLAIVVGMSLLASLFVAFTFIPSLGARILSVLEKDEESPVDQSKKQPLYVRFYGGLIGFTTRFPWVTVGLAALAFAGSWHLFDKYVTRGVLWGGLWGGQTSIDVQIRFPRGSSLERTDELTRFFEQKLKQMPEVKQFTSRVYPQFGRITVTFPKAIEETQIPVAIKEQMVAYSHQFGGTDVRVYGYGPSFYGGGGSAPNYSIRVFGYNYEKVREIALDLKTRLERFSRVRDVDINAGGRFFSQGEKETEIVVDLDRERLAQHDLTVRDVLYQVQAATGGRTSDTRLRVGGEEVGLEVKTSGYREIDVLQLAETLLRSPAGGEAVRLANIGTITERDVLNIIERENQQYKRTVRYEFRGPTKLGDRYRDAVIAATALPDGYRIEGRQDWNWGGDEQKQIAMVLAVSLVLIFMVTAALFESLRLPISVLLTVPMALIGVFMIFFYTEASFTREAYIGVIMMGGIVVNNAILLVDHINQLRRRSGKPLLESVLQGTLERVRPILMTSATTIFGLLPLVIFSDGANANIWNALGFALIGGLISSTFFVLTITPALYVLFERGPERRRLAREQAVPTTQLSQGPTGDVLPSPA